MNRTENKKTNLLQTFILLISLGVFLFSVIKIGEVIYSNAKNEQIMNEIQSKYHNSLESSSLKTEESSTSSALQSLLTINTDIVGWVTIDQTKIDYPILQGSDNEFYLQRNYKKENAKEGSIFMDYRNEVDSENRQTIIYGHEMKNGSMFGQLKKFLEKDFFTQNRNFHYETVKDSYEVEIFSIYVTTTNFHYLKTDFSSDEEYGDFIQTITKKSEFQTDVTVGEKDQIITLSTCNNLLDPDEGRLVVHGKLIKKNNKG